MEFCFTISVPTSELLLRIQKVNEQTSFFIMLVMIQKRTIQVQSSLQCQLVPCFSYVLIVFWLVVTFTYTDFLNLIVTREKVGQMQQFGAVHKFRHFKTDLYGSSNNDSTWCYVPSGVLNNDEWLTKFTFFGIGPKISVQIITSWS